MGRLDNVADYAYYNFTNESWDFDRRTILVKVSRDLLEC